MDNFPKTRTMVRRPNWLLDVEPYPRHRPESLVEVRDNLRLKKHLKRAVEQDVAPLSLIQAIKAEIRK